MPRHNMSVDFDEQEFWPDHDQPQILFGTVGWEGEDSWYEKGTDKDDGHTFVKVQLFSRRDPTTEYNPSVGQGRKILCHIGSGIFRIPPKGTVVYVAVPHGFGSCPPGMGVILTAIEQNPMLQYDDDRVQINFGEDKHIVIRGKSVTMTDPDNRFLMVGTARAGGDPCIVAQDETGSGWIVSEGKVALISADGGTVNSIYQMTGDKVELVCTASGGAGMKIESGSWSAFGAQAFLTAGFVGLGPAPALPAVKMAPGPTPVPSTCVLIS